MKNKWIIIGVAAVCALLAGTGTAAITYNPIKWIKKTPGPTASEQPAANKEEEKRSYRCSCKRCSLLAQASRMRVRGFKSLNDCCCRALRKPQSPDQIQLP